MKRFRFDACMYTDTPKKDIDFNLTVITSPTLHRQISDILTFSLRYNVENRQNRDNIVLVHEMISNALLKKRNR